MLLYFSSSDLQYFLKSDLYFVRVCIYDLLQMNSKFGHQVTSLALLGSKVGHQVVSLALPHCLGMPHWYYQLVLSSYLHHPESHQFSLHKVTQWVSEFQTTGPIDRTPGTPGSDKNYVGGDCVVAISDLLCNFPQLLTAYLKQSDRWIRKCQKALRGTYLVLKI